MHLTICYTTARKAPMIEWALADLCAQRQGGDRFDLVVVDFFERGELELGIVREHLPGLERVVCVGPKPTMWQGRYRVCKRDMWAASNARNTAMIYAPADADYLVFLDDRVHLRPTWLDVVRRYERDRLAIVCGPYDKEETVNGERRLSVDHRWQHQPGGQIGCSGSWLYGGNFAMPIAWALSVGGFEEGCDSVGGEDYVFGKMLENAGRRIDFDVKMHAVQDRIAIDHPFPRNDKGVSPNDKSHAMNRRYLSRRHVDKTTSPDIVELRRRAQAGEPMPPPDASARDWYDGTFIKDNP